MKLEDRVAIVTEGANEIGRAISLGLAKEGANVVVAEIEAKTANEVVNEIKALGRKAIAIITEVITSEKSQRMAEANFITRQNYLWVA